MFCLCTSLVIYSADIVICIDFAFARFSGLFWCFSSETYFLIFQLTSAYPICCSLGRTPVVFLFFFSFGPANDVPLPCMSRMLCTVLRETRVGLDCSYSFSGRDVPETPPPSGVNVVSTPGEFRFRCTTLTGCCLAVTAR